MCRPQANSAKNLALGWEGAKEICRRHLSLVTNSRRSLAVVVNFLSRRALGSGNLKNVSKTNGLTAHEIKKKNMVKINKKHGQIQKNF